VIGRLVHPGRSTNDPRVGSRGQALIEFAIIVPAFLLILTGMLEFGFVFNHNLNLEYATREGARTGSALANGGVSNCPSLNTSDGLTLDPDPYIIAAVQRVLTSPGSPVDISQVSQVQIWKNDPANPGVALAGKVNTWANTGSGTGPTVDGVKLTFTQSSRNWHVCERDNGSVPPDSVGISLKYTYKFVTPLAGVMTFFGPGGASTLSMSDQTVMSLNPTN